MALLYDLLEDRKNIEEEYKIFVLPFLLRNSELASRYCYTFVNIVFDVHLHLHILRLCILFCFLFGIKKSQLQFA